MEDKPRSTNLFASPRLFQSLLEARVPRPFAKVFAMKGISVDQLRRSFAGDQEAETLIGDILRQAGVLDKSLTSRLHWDTLKRELSTPVAVPMGKPVIEIQV